MRLHSLKFQLGGILSNLSNRAFNMNLGKVARSQKHSDYESNCAQMIHDFHRKDSYKHIEPSITPQSLAIQVIDLADRQAQEFELEADSFGLIRIKLRDSFLEQYLNKIIKEKQFSLSELSSFTKIHQLHQSNHMGVIYPITGLCSGVSLTQFRQWNVLQWIARTHEYVLGQTAKRVHCLLNNSEFDGLVLAYIKESKPDRTVQMTDLAEFLAKKELATAEDISNFGRLTLSEVAVDKTLQQIYDELYTISVTHRDILFSDFTYDKFESKKLKKNNPKEIYKELVKAINSPDIFAADEIEGAKTVKIGEISDENALDYLKKLSKSISDRIRVTMPEIDAEIQTGLDRRWMRYYLSLFKSADRMEMANPTDLTNIIFTKGEERRQLHEREALLKPEEFKIRSKTDRELAMLVCDIGDHFEEFQFSEIHNKIEKLHKIMKRIGGYPSVAITKAVMDKYYQVLAIS